MMIHPIAIGVAVVVAIGMFAPHLLKPIGRMLGKTVRKEVERRMGVTPTIKRLLKNTQPSNSPKLPEVTAQSVETEIINTQPEHQELSPKRQLKTPAMAYAWTIGLGIAAVAGVLLWILLQSR